MANDTNKIYFSALFQGLSGIVHGFSGRDSHDLQNFENQPDYFKSLGIKFDRLITLDQVHGVKIKIINSSDLSNRYSGYDGQIYLKNNSTKISPALCIESADCVPVLFCDIRKNIIGAAHSGWKGTILNISGIMIDKMMDMGSNPKEIFVALGPYIKSCCYSVEKKRMMEFSNLFKDNPSVIVNREGTWYIDIGNAIIDRIRNKGIPSEHISQSEICTSCNNDRFFSYRGDRDGFGGKNISFISFT